MGDVRMVERREDLSLPMETGKALGIADEQIRKDLQGDFSIELRVAGAIDLAHATRAEERDDLVGTQTRAGSQRQVGYPSA